MVLKFLKRNGSGSATGSANVPADGSSSGGADASTSASEESFVSHLVELRDRAGSPGQQLREARAGGDPQPTRRPAPGATVLRPTPPPPIPTEP
jgi:hypothetical protein